jgi:hypothetical protein
MTLRVVERVSARHEVFSLLLTYSALVVILLDNPKLGSRLIAVQLLIDTTNQRGELVVAPVLPGRRLGFLEEQLAVLVRLIGAADRVTYPVGIGPVPTTSRDHQQNQPTRTEALHASV